MQKSAKILSALGGEKDRGNCQILASVMGQESGFVLRNGKGRRFPALSRITAELMRSGRWSRSGDSKHRLIAGPGGSIAGARRVRRPWRRWDNKICDVLATLNPNPTKSASRPQLSVMIQIL
jgi:hypothetical protein